MLSPEANIVVLFVALNQYISTGDQIGWGVALQDKDDRWTVLIPHAPNSRLDTANWECLAARIGELEKGRFPLTLERVGSEGFGPNGERFVVHGLSVAKQDVRRLTERLFERPGPLGWGSLRPLLVAHGLVPQQPLARAAY